MTLGICLGYFHMKFFSVQSVKADTQIPQWIENKKQLKPKGVQQQTRETKHKKQVDSNLMSANESSEAIKWNKNTTWLN